jgi:hypothetical protein
VYSDVWKYAEPSLIVGAGSVLLSICEKPVGGV